MLTNRQLFLLHLGQTSDEPLMIEITKAEGVCMYGPSGEKYIDLISGVSVSNTGHRHPRVIAAVREQTDSYLHLMVYGEIIQSPQVKYAELLASLLPPSLNTCFFVNSGSEAVEGAMKLAKRFTGRTRIIYFKDSYHGSTHGALSIQGSDKYKNAFRPLLPDTLQIRFNDFSDLSAIDEHTAAVIIEPVQAEAGVIFPEEGFIGEIRKRCSENGALLVFDEAQTAFGRIGHIFAINRFNVAPDILILAKALGGGMPLGAFISSETIMSSLVNNPRLGHITTFGGHPVCCAAGLASMNVIIDENLAGQCAAKSTAFRRELSHPVIKEVRGEGLLLAIQLTEPRYVRYAIKHAPDHGIILDYFLFCEDAFRIAPPLIITEEEIMESCRQVRSLLDEAVNNSGKE